jgi:WD40 repeat protein
MSEKPEIRVFISSPSDVLVERDIAEHAIARLNFVWNSSVNLRSVRWEREYFDASRSFQEALEEMSAFDIVLGILWKRIGSPLRSDKFTRPDGSSYESGTVFEIESALQAAESAPYRPKVYLLKKTEEVRYAADRVDYERQQHELLESWWTRTVFDADHRFRRGYQSFADADSFEDIAVGIVETYLVSRSLIPTGPVWDIAAKGSPFPGLVPYEFEHRQVFFGRSLAIVEAKDELTAVAKRGIPFLLIVGPSGSGKSSLARAGILPLFEGMGFTAEIDSWRRVTLDPSPDALVALSEALYSAEVLPELARSPAPDPASFVKLALAAPEGAAKNVAWALDQAAERERRQNLPKPKLQLVLLLDQLETFLGSSTNRPAFQLVKAMVEDAGVWVIATLRSDRYPDFQLEPSLRDLRKRGALYDLPPPGATEIGDIVKGPAKLAGLEFDVCDGVSLATLIKREVGGPDALPLLQMALAHLFSVREGNRLTCAAYSTMGGIGGAIAVHAEAVFATVSPQGQQSLDALLRELVVNVDLDGRLDLRTVDRNKLDNTAGAKELADKLIEARLLVQAGDTIRVAHEALLRRWKRATESPALQPEAIQLRRKIEPDLETWKETGLDADLLQGGTTTLAAADLLVKEHPGALSKELEAFVTRSVQVAKERADAEKLSLEATARKIKRWLIAACIAALAFGLSAILAWELYGQARRGLGLALLTKAQSHLEDDHPLKALVTAGTAIDLATLRAFTGSRASLDEASPEGIRARSIVSMANGASVLPLETFRDFQRTSAVALRRDGSAIAYGSMDGQALVREANSAKPIVNTIHKGEINALRFSPDGNLLLSAGADLTIHVWDLKGKSGRSLTEHASVVNDLDIDSRSRYFASTGNDGIVIVWDLKTLTRIKTLPLQGWGFAVEFSADGSTLAASDGEGNVFLWNVADWTPKAHIETASWTLVSLALNSDASQVITAGVDGPVDLWDTRTLKRIARIQEREKVWKVRYLRGWKLIAVAMWDGTVRIWDAETLNVAGTLDASDDWIRDLAVTGDGLKLATAGKTGTVRVWDLHSLQPVFETTRDNLREVLVGQYSGNGQFFLSGGRDSAARIYKVTEQGRLVRSECEIKHEDWVVSAAISHDAKLAASAGAKDGGSQNFIRLWNPQNCSAPQDKVEIGSAFPEKITLDRSAARLAYGTRKGEIAIVDLATGNRVTLRTPQAAAYNVYALQFHPSEEILASGGLDNAVTLWPLKPGQSERVLRGWPANAYVSALSYSPDGRLIAAAGSGGKAYVWNPETSDEPIATLEIGAESNSVAFSPDGQSLAVGSDLRDITLWSTRTWTKTFHWQSNAHVGVRGVFGFHPLRSDLAFDGGGGSIRIIPRLQAEVSHNFQGLAPSLQGTEVSLDGPEARRQEKR